MKRVYIEDIGEYEDQEIELRGWLYQKRSSGKLHFLQVRDGTGTVQCVIFFKDVDEETFKLADHITQESSIIVTGTVRADKRSPIGFEVGVSALKVQHMAEEYPITPKEHGVSFLMDHRHLWLRSSRQQAILRIRAEVIRAVRDFFDQKGFVLVDAPIFTPAACEGTTTLFATDYFGTQAYLTQSGQLYMEAAALALGKVYCFGPTFRAEKSKTRRHLTEFWMVEPEIAYAVLDDIMDLAEEFILFILERIMENKRMELKTIDRDIGQLEMISKPFPRITYDKAVELLKEQGLEVAPDDDFGAEHETVLCQQFHRPILVHRYPTQCKAFYMKKDGENPARSLSVDVLAPEGYGEIIGGGQREDEVDVLLESINKHELPPEAFKWYLDLRRYGSVPHGGFGMGIERAVSWICGLPHVRETIPFPRLLERLTP